MLGIPACSRSYHTLEYSQTAPFLHIAEAVLVDGLEVVCLILYGGFNLGTYLPDTFDKQLGYPLELHN